MIWLWLACSTSITERVAGDLSVSLDEVWESCQEFADPDDVGACMLEALKARDQLVSAQCGRVVGRWRGQCVLQAAEAAHGSLSGRYRACKKDPDTVESCRFLLWQADVLAVLPGHPDHAHELMGIREVIKAHRLYAKKDNPDLQREIWAWFWGAWWEQMELHSPSGRDLNRCRAFASPIDVRLCQELAPAAFQWIDERVHPPDAPSVDSPQ